MFKNLPKLSKSAPASDDTLQQTIDAQKRALEDKDREIETLREMIGHYQAGVHAIQNTLIELTDKCDPLVKPTIQSLIALRTPKLADLPGLLLDRDPQAAGEFERFTGQDPAHFTHPARAVTELLSYRLHTIVKLLTNVIAHENIGPSDVLYQAKHDVDVMLAAEAAQRQAAAGRRGPPRKG